MIPSLLLYKQFIFEVFHDHHGFFFLIPVTDGSLGPSSNIAVVDEENFTYINGETNTTVWPGL